MTKITTNITDAAEALRQNRLVAFPTETVYGLGGNALSDRTVASIYAVKKRPDFNPLIVHVSSIQQASQYVTFNDTAKLLAQNFWPGPLTMVLPRVKGSDLSLLVSAGLDTVAIRIPAYDMAHQLLEACNLPIAAPSANISGHISPTRPLHVMEELEGDIDMILDGGACNIGIESTVIAIEDNHVTILRHGSVTREALLPYVDSVSQAGEDADISAPGMLSRHYAPEHGMRLKATHVEAHEGLLAFGHRIPVNATIVENLSVNSNLEEAAANLFTMLRTLDAKNIRSIAVMTIPEEGLGIAINDRLRRAAAPKED